MLLSGSEHIYWILDLEDEVHSIWIIWTNGLQECKNNFIFQSRVEWATFFSHDINILDLFYGGLPIGAGSWGPRPYPPPPESL